MRFDFNYIDPRTGLPGIKDQNTLDRLAKFMNIMPSRSGYVWFIDNTVAVNTVGNNRYKVRYYYDMFTKTFKTDRNSNDGIPFRDVRLKNGSKPHFWIYEEDFRKAGWNGIN